MRLTLGACPADIPIVDPLANTQFMIWGSAYVALKWTVGLWALRRVKVALAGRRAIAARN